MTRCILVNHSISSICGKPFIDGILLGKPQIVDAHAIYRPMYEVGVFLLTSLLVFSSDSSSVATGRTGTRTSDNVPPDTGDSDGAEAFPARCLQREGKVGASVPHS